MSSNILVYIVLISKSEAVVENIAREFISTKITLQFTKSSEKSIYSLTKRQIEPRNSNFLYCKRKFMAKIRQYQKRRKFLEKNYNHMVTYKCDKCIRKPPDYRFLESLYFSVTVWDTPTRRHRQQRLAFVYEKNEKGKN